MTEYLCEKCWLVMQDGNALVCRDCRETRPPKGWSSMPYLFRRRYELSSQLGRGGFGAVFRAKDRDANDQEVAIKVVQIKGTNTNEAVERFYLEHAAAAVLGIHPTFVTVHGFESAPVPFLSLELVLWPT